MKISKKLADSIINWTLKEENKRFMISPAKHEGDVAGIPHLEYSPLHLVINNFPFESLAIIEREILKHYNFKEFYRDKTFGIILSYSKEGHVVHEHNDPAFRDEDACTRINVFLSKPEEGGIAVINGKEVEVDELESWVCVASEFKHSSTKVKGNKPRIVLSFGYQVLKEELKQKNIL